MSLLPIELQGRNPRLRPYALRRATAGVALLPLALPTADHLRERLEEIAERAASVEGLQPTTLARWRVARHSFFAFLAERGCGDRFVSGDYRLQAVLIEDWIGWMRARNAARSSIATYWHSLAAQVGRIEREDGMLNPWSLLDAPKPGKALPRSLTRTQAERLLALVRNEPGSSFARSRNLCAVGLMLLAGVRRGEALALQVADCDLERRTLLVRHGKGRNGGAPRMSYMTEQLAQIIADYLVERTRLRLSHPELLTLETGDRALSVTAARRHFRRWSAALGFRVTPHMLRHTYALLLRQSGVPDRVSMDLLGHHSLSMLQRYSHVFDGEHQREAAKVILDL